MAIKLNTKDQYGRSNYIGVLYGFDINDTGDGVEITPYFDWTPLGTNNREPANLTQEVVLADYNNLQCKMDSEEMYNIFGVEWTETLFQEEYNELLESVISNKGFYIGRYETGRLEGATISKKGATTISVPNWIQIYNTQKNIYGDTAETKTHMIWGSQWDQVMIWMKDVKNSMPSTNSRGPFFILDSIGMGVYGGTYNAIETMGEFKVKNIYDLAGNVGEWTMEASGRGNRTVRDKYIDLPWGIVIRTY